MKIRLDLRKLYEVSQICDLESSNLRNKSVFIRDIRVGSEVRRYYEATNGYCIFRDYDIIKEVEYSGLALDGENIQGNRDLKKLAVIADCEVFEVYIQSEYFRFSLLEKFEDFYKVFDYTLSLVQKPSKFYLFDLNTMKKVLKFTDSQKSYAGLEVYEYKICPGVIFKHLTKTVCLMSKRYKNY